MKILITGIGGPTPRSLARSLRWYSHYSHYELIGTDINPYARDLYDTSLYNKTYLIPRADADSYWPVIREIVERHSIDFALVQPEVEVLEWAAKADLGQLPCKGVFPDFKLAELMVDKSKLTALLADSGLVPKSVDIDPASPDFALLESTLAYPFWIRSTSGSSGLGSLKVENRPALENWIRINPGVRKFIASEFLPGRNLACKLLYYDGSLVRAATGERVHYIMSKVAPSGITGNTSFGRLLNESKLVELSCGAMDILFEKTGADRHGFFTVDLKESADGRPLITEINIRHVAFSVCFAAGGANFAEDMIRLLDQDPEFEKTFVQYQFEKDLIFLRDVDAKPLLIKEKELLNP